MAIIVNNPGETRTVDSGSDAASWMLAVAVIIILIVGAVYLLPRIAYRGTPAPAAPGANINVTLPANTGSTGGTSGTTGGTGGTTQ
jgi:hypothetical protein